MPHNSASRRVGFQFMDLFLRKTHGVFGFNVPRTLILRALGITPSHDLSSDVSLLSFAAACSGRFVGLCSSDTLIPPALSV